MPGVYKTILVIGGGISGITAAIEAAETGYDVVLVEKEAYLGGRVAQLAKYFPKLCPANCGLEINYQRIKKNRRIRIITMSQVTGISGQPGDFDVTIAQQPRYVNARCTACNDCVAVCPEDRPDAFNLGMGTTKAIYLPHAMAFPMKYAIDDSRCKGQSCGKCVDACKYGAIELNMQPKTFTLKAGAVIVATGWKPYDASRIDNLGFGRYADVITNMMLERLAAADGPTRGKLARPSDGKPISSAAFIQCAGSRDENHLGYCSSICCMASLKEATYIREQNPDARIYVFYIDLRTPGTYNSFSQRVREDGHVTAIKGKVARIVEDAPGRQLIVEAEKVFTAEKVRVPVDLVVLATGMASSHDGGNPPALFSLDADNFPIPREKSAGVFVAGCARGPVEVATAVQDATAAAMKAMESIHQAGTGALS